MATYPATASAAYTTTIHDLPEPILSKIVAAISDTRTRNAASRVSRKWYELERSTRISLSLRGNVRDLLFLPNSFPSVTHLDLSHLSPWGHPLLASFTADNYLLAHRIAAAFPAITHLILYVRHPSVTLSLLCPHWPNLTHVKLVRWHQRPPGEGPHGSELFPLLESCRSISVLDLSSFYCWTEDIPAALKAFPDSGVNLSRLDLLNSSFAEGFKSNEIEEITVACPNLREFLVPCTFDSRYIGPVGNGTLLSISTNCKNLRVLHLADISGEVGGDGEEDAGFSVPGLIEFFCGLEHIEELVLDVCKNVRESWAALDVLVNRCPNLKTLKLGQFQTICRAIESQLDGVALCKGLVSLSIKDSADLTDLRLIAIARGCSRLEKLEIHGCNQVTVRGLRTMASLLWRTLVDVNISKCPNLDAVTSLQAVEPICDRIKRLHIDCVWSKAILEGEGEYVELPPPVEDLFPFDLNEVDDGSSNHDDQQQRLQGEEDCNGDGGRSTKRPKFWSELEDDQQQHQWNNQFAAASSNGGGEFSLGCNGGGGDDDIDNYSNNFSNRRRWTKLEFLSLWIGVGDLITPLTSPTLGIEDCPNLREIHIKAEGDCREKPRPPNSRPTFGLSSLVQYPSLCKLKLNLGDMIGYALTAPSGHVDLSLWERFYLGGIDVLVSLEELDYWPPHDREVNQRSVSLPGAGLLMRCSSLRKLFIHGTVHEHFLSFLVRIENNLRDVQLREDYYPAPEDDMSTEMRVDSWRRFEESLNRRAIPD